MQIKQTLVQPGSTILIRSFHKGNSPAGHSMFQGNKREMWWVSEDELWVGLGDAATPGQMYQIFRAVFFTFKDRWPNQLTLDAKPFNEAELESIVNGILIGGYDIQLYKSKPKPISGFFGEKGRLNILVSTISEEADESIALAQKLAVVQRRAMDLMNAPGNFVSPRHLANWVIQSGEAHQYAVHIIEKGELESIGADALLAVSRGSDQEPVMIVSVYTPEHYTKTIALVGKGVTFDTGGISIKGSHNMHLMKSDMGGAAAVMGVVELAAQMKMPVRIIGIIPSTENAVDGSSLKPGDVIGSYSGKTIEVIDTDAEGRLILADGLHYAVKQYQPDILIDLATLTGSVIQTLGYEAAGLFSNNDVLANALLQAGELTGERLWRFPLWDSYAGEIESDIADVKNHHGKPLAGAIVAAKFLEVFTAEHPAWAHLDIAGMAFGEPEFAPGKAGTAYGIRLLYHYLHTL
jgi:leucyl aminopeptidase